MAQGLKVLLCKPDNHQADPQNRQQRGIKVSLMSVIPMCLQQWDMESGESQG